MHKLATKIVDKPWGKRGIDPRFGVDPDRQVGEIWFESPPGRELDVMAKYLFTTERLSIQVHPDDATARTRGFPRGKDECWIVLDVAEDAELGIGTVRHVESGKLMDAAVCPAAPAIFAEVTSDRPCCEIAATVAWIRSSFEPLGRSSLEFSGFAAIACSVRAAWASF